MGHVLDSTSSALLDSGGYAVLDTLGSASTYYASNTASNGYSIGDDDNAGVSKSSPWLTEEHAFESTNVGDYVWFNAGEYDTINITEPTRYQRTESGFIVSNPSTFGFIVTAEFIQFIG
jgi:hypothetical protein